MGKITVQPTIMMHWYELVKDAQVGYGRKLGEDLEHYLALLLQRYVDKPDVIASVLAIEYLQAIEKGGSFQRETLRDVGDKCLLFSGLFPECADKKRVSINYFVDLGRSAYGGVAENVLMEEGMVKLFIALEKHFVGMMDVLHTIREMGSIDNEISLLHAFDLWEHTQSEYARAVLERHTDGFPIKLNSNNK